MQKRTKTEFTAKKPNVRPENKSRKNFVYFLIKKNNSLTLKECQ
jgi:hypothetical protein